MFILEKAETYHRFSGLENIGFIDDLKKKINGIDNIKELHYQYNRIFNSSPSKLINVFPESINGNRFINGFMAKEVARSASKMLDKIVSISEIRSEDKYNDLVEIVLDSRINTWGWYVGEQSRGGFSDAQNKSKKKQPGERDLPIHDTNKELFCICEAFIYRTPAPAKSHLKKIFDYYHQRENLIILIYDLKPMNESKENWKQYITKIVPNTDFPEGYKYKGCGDVTAEFGYQNSAIRIALSTHENNNSIYHVFVNINYRVT